MKHNRKRFPVFRGLALVPALCLLLSAQPPPQANGLKEIADARVSSADAMQVSIDKQKAAVRLQVGPGGAAAPFFTTPWVNLPVIELPAQCDAMAEADLTPLVKASAQSQNVDAKLIRAVIRRESASSACAVSPKGAVGLMQLMPETARTFGADPFDPKQNIEAGAAYLKQLLGRYKNDVSLALAAYNAGSAVVDRAAGIPKIAETTEYVKAILKELGQAADAAIAPAKPE